MSRDLPVPENPTACNGEPITCPYLANIGTLSRSIETLSLSVNNLKAEFQVMNVRFDNRDERDRELLATVKEQLTNSKSGFETNRAAIVELSKAVVVLQTEIRDRADAGSAWDRYKSWVIPMILSIGIAALSLHDHVRWRP